LFICNSKNQTVLKKRTTNGIWKNLYEFPLIETESTLNKPNIQFKKIISKYSKKKYKIDPVLLKSQIHKLSHQTLMIKFWKILLPDDTNLPIKKNQILSYAVPVVIEKFIDQYY